MAFFMYLPDGRSIEQVFAPISGAAPVAATQLYDASTSQDAANVFFPLLRARQAPLTGFLHPTTGQDLADVFDTSAGVPKAFGGSNASRPSTQNGSATAYVTMKPDGSVLRQSTPTGTNLTDSWLTVLRAGAGGEFEFWWQRNFGPAGSLTQIPSTEATWANISADRGWACFAANNNTSLVEIYIAIRRIGSTSETAFTFRLNAQGGGND